MTLLTGLLRTNEGMGVQMFASLRIDLGAVRAKMGPDRPDAKQPQHGEAPDQGE